MDGMIEIKKLSEIEDDVRTKMAEVFAISYYEELSIISKDIEKLIKIFRDSFTAETFYIAFMDGELAGFLGCSDNMYRAINISKEVILAELGKIKGSLIFKFLDKEFNTPIAYTDDIAYIEAVATHPEARDKGVATRLIEHVMLKSGYSEFRLTVKDNNRKALSVYRRIGFVEVDRIKASFFEKKYFKFKIYMRYREETDIFEDDIFSQIDIV
ncbi:MAG: GNAT family N-acetyltransferase [Defluviitaleaceae bacterium]|nr:GNAT family N-acetyltransferase [Defluviitaleaceae bacterium]